VGTSVPALCGNLRKDSIMICWVAGWPHNGSTICRQILKDSFDMLSVSSYLETELEDLFPGSNSFCKEWSGDPEGKFDYYQSCEKTIFIKTHDIPVDGSPAIFVYRDGRDAVTALSGFWRFPVEYLIIGARCHFGSWSGLYHAWNPKKRKKTLMVKYEDMVKHPNKVAEQIARFLDVKQVRPYVDDFDEKKKEFPHLFNDRIGVWKSKMTDSQLDLFWRCHGHVMEELGYER